MRLALHRLGSVLDSSTGESWSGARLAEEAEARAARLRALDVGRGARVLVRHGGTPAFFADLFALWQVGACAACLNPELTTPELETVAAFVRPALTISVAGMADAPPAVGRTVALGDERLPRSDDRAADAVGALDDPALILFTSGTTGTPKGVVHTFRSLLARLALNRLHIPAEERRVTLCPLPTHFGHGLIGNALTVLIDGGDLVLARGANLRTAAALGTLIDQYGVGFMSSVPTLWKIVTKAAKPPTKGTLRRVHVGSAPLSADLWKQIVVWSGTRNVVNMYGITETANWIAGASAAEFEPEDGLIGRMWGGSAGVCSADGRIRATGEGEIALQTPSLMQGYYERPELSGAALRGGWFMTGDIGRIDSDGVMRLVGRQKHEINRAGLKVHPEDIDVLLERHESVREACAFGVPDEIAGEIVAVALAPADGGTLDLAELKRWAAGRLAREKLPERWYVLDEIPKTDRGKINRDTVARACTTLTPR